MSGLFSTFNVATRGMGVQQVAIEVTSHNIANANTEGYSRQKAVIETSRPFGMPTLNNAAEVGQLGTGALVSSIQRIRDTFLDYQIRSGTSKLGEFQARDRSLGEVEQIFNEPSDSGLSSLLGKFYASWQSLATAPESSTARTLVAQQSDSLAKSLNHNYTQLTMVKQNTQSEIKTSVYDVNSILDQVDQLNQQIIGVQVSGNQPNDLMDKRDLLLDTLSSKFNINIEKKNFMGNDVSPIVEAGSAPTNTNLVQSLNNSDVKRFSYINSIMPQAGNPTSGPGVYKYDVTYYKNGDAKNAVTITVTGDENTFKNLDESRVLWANKDGNALASGDVIASSGVNYNDLKIFRPISGEIKGYMSVQQDTDNYIDQMNQLAKALAFSVNAIHNANITDAGDVTNGGIDFFVNSSTPPLSTAEQDITAGNIAVNGSILSNAQNINVQKDKLAGTSSGSGDGKRALAIAKLKDSLIKIQDIGINTTRINFLANNSLSADTLSLINNKDGTKFENFFKDIVAKVGIQEQAAKSIVSSQQSALGSIEQNKESVSGVLLDEEMANLVQFQHAYQANAKIISTIDELLDVVINGLKR